MALRPQISGFKLEKLTKLFDCKDESLVEPLIKNFDEFVTMDDPSEQERGHKIIRKIIMGEITSGGEEKEDETFIWVIISLASYEQDHIITDSNIWKVRGCFEYIRNLKGKVDDEIYALLKHFIDGRPFFGKEIETSWSYYAYLTEDEVKKLLEAINNNKIMVEDEYGFGKDLKRWLEDISRTNADLWFYAY